MLLQFLDIIIGGTIDYFVAVLAVLCILLIFIGIGIAATGGTSGIWFITLGAAIGTYSYWYAHAPKPMDEIVERAMGGNETDEMFMKFEPDVWDEMHERS